jgi:Protein of unknown function (DUF3592)
MAAAIVVAFGLVILCAALILARSRLEMIRTWKPVEVQVIRNWMETHEAGVGGEESTSYSAHYELAYTIEGRSIRAAARSEDVFLDGPQPVQTRLSRHTAGTRGVAYVNPSDPDTVRFDLGNNVNIIALPLWLVVAGFTLLLIGLSLWLMATPTVFW